MKAASLLFASLLAAVPAAATAQGMDVPTGASAAPSPTADGAAPAADAPAVKPPKSGPYFGFSFGTGKGTMYSGGSSMDIDEMLGASGETPTTLHMQLRSGWGTGDFLFGAQLNFTRSFIEVNGVSAGLDFMAVDMVATWWDQEMGLYSRVGIGPSVFSAYAGDTTSDSYSGVELMFGIGATIGGAGVGIDMFRQAYDANETGFDSVTYMMVTLSLDMY